MIEPGTLLQDRYRVGAQIGKGGMGEVYLATDRRFQSAVAIKRTFYDDPEMLKAFEREARLLNRLRHSALPKVSDHFSEGGEQFLVMEFIDGSDLSELLAQRKIPFPLADVLRWADELLDALDYLHTQQPPVVHRDIKPHNIKLTSAGKVLLLDFGLAKAMLGQTTSGTAQSVFGYSLNFAPLEQIQGTGTDPRSDLYSLAATLYYLLTGTHPPDALARATAIIKQQPDPLRPAHLVQAQVPAAVSQILHRAMSQDSALRHASAVELRAELRQATAEVSLLPLEAQSLPSAAHFLTQSMPTPEESGPIEPPVQFKSVASTVRERPHSEIHARTVHTLTPPGEDAFKRTDARPQPRPSDSFTVLARPASQSAKTSRTLALVACLLVVCVATVAFLLSHSSSSIAPNATANTEAQEASGPLHEQTAPVEHLSPGASSTSSDSSHITPDSNAPAQSAEARTVSETQSSNSQVAAEPVKTQSQPGMSAKEKSATVDSTSYSATEASPAGQPALVIQNPAPAINPADEKRRLEESRREQTMREQAMREQTAARPEYPAQPPPGGPYPPPPGGRWPPPPDGRRPPPDFRPPHP